MHLEFDKFGLKVLRSLRAHGDGEGWVLRACRVCWPPSCLGFSFLFFVGGGSLRTFENKEVALFQGFGLLD